MELSPITACGGTSAVAHIVLVSIVLWPFAAPMAIARRCDLRVFAIGPLVIGTLGAALGAWNVEQRSAISHSHGAAFAAGTAENLMMAMAGALMTGLIAVAVAVLPRIDDARRARTRGTELIMALNAVALGCIAVQRFLLPMIILSCAVLLTVLIVCVIRAKSVQPRTGRYAFFGIALASFCAAFVLFRLIEHYRAIALGRA